MTPYEIGFISKCAECGVPADRVPELLKYAAGTIRPAGATGKAFAHRRNPSAYALSSDATKAPIGPYGPTSLKSPDSGMTLRRNEITPSEETVPPVNTADDAFRRSVLTAYRGRNSLDSLTRAGEAVKTLAPGVVKVAPPTAVTST